MADEFYHIVRCIAKGVVAKLRIVAEPAMLIANSAAIDKKIINVDRVYTRALFPETTLRKLLVHLFVNSDQVYACNRRPSQGYLKGFVIVLLK